MVGRIWFPGQLTAKVGTDLADCLPSLTRLGLHVLQNKHMYVTGEMVLLGEKDLPKRNGFAVRQIRFAWTEQANWIWNYFRSYLRDIFIQFWTYIIQYSYHLLKNTMG